MDRIRSIVVPTDFSRLSEAAAARAVWFAQLDGAAVHLVHAVRFPLIVTPYEVSVPAAMREGIQAAAQERLEDTRKAIERAAGPECTVTAEVLDATDAAQAIDEVAAEHDADLIVMGTHGHTGIRHAVLGSVAERTLRTVDRPILAVKEEPADAARPIARILVPVDFSEESDCAVATAAGLARRLGADVTVVHAIDLPHDYVPYASPFGSELEESIDAAAAQRLAQVGERFSEAGVSVSLETRRGHAADAIGELAMEQRTQLIVMGTRGNSGLAHVLLGSVAERTLRTAPCSVLAVKASRARSGD